MSDEESRPVVVDVDAEYKSIFGEDSSEGGDGGDDMTEDMPPVVQEKLKESRQELQKKHLHDNEKIEGGDGGADIGPDGLLDVGGDWTKDDGRFMWYGKKDEGGSGEVFSEKDEPAVGDDLGTTKRWYLDTDKKGRVVDTNQGGGFGGLISKVFGKQKTSS